MYNNEEKAIRFVTIAFAGKKRKKEKIDMSYHSIIVGNMLKSINASEEIVLTGYLHDIIEDTDYGYEDIKKIFGEKIADNVELISENSEICDYMKRKIDFINKLKTLSPEILSVEVADKLHNLISDYDEFQKRGREVLCTYADNYEKLKWYYLTLKDLFNEKLENNILLERYNKITDIYFKD